MKIYSIKRKQTLPVTLQEAWDFFSSPNNLAKITPMDLGFTIQSVSGGEKIYAGQLIRYKVKVLPFYVTQWVTEITHVNVPHYFVDEQRFGPYALWHHQHHFKETTDGVEMTDEVNYAIPLSFLGRLAHFLFVKDKVNTIFNYREKVLNEYFKKDKMKLFKTV